MAAGGTKKLPRILITYRVICTWKHWRYQHDNLVWM